MVYRISSTPDPASVAVRVTVTVSSLHSEHPRGLQEIDVRGGTESGGGGPVGWSVSRTVFTMVPLAAREASQSRKAAKVEGETE